MMNQNNLRLEIYIMQNQKSKYYLKKYKSCYLYLYFNIFKKFPISQ